MSTLVLNRLQPFAPECLPHSLEVSDEIRASLDKLLDYYHYLFEEQKTWILKFESLLPAKPIFRIERQLSPLHDVTSLAALPGLDISGF